MMTLLVVLMCFSAPTTAAVSMYGVIRHLLPHGPVSCRMDLSQQLPGNPISPRVDLDPVLVRYMYDGGTLAQGRLTQLQPADPNVARGTEVLRALVDDGVDLRHFFACIYESEASTGSWLPVLREVTSPHAEDLAHAKDVELPLKPTAADGSRVARRIDVKLFRRTAPSFDAARADQAAQPSGKIPKAGYFGIGVINAKNQANLGTLWRSAYQLGSSFLFTIGTRYKHQPTDTVNAITRVPFFELDDWNAFAQTFAPRGALWVAVEFGGTPLSSFDHPLDAVYILGSEDAGLPTSVLRACHATVSLESENYASYNVAVAGSLIMYDRMAKQRAGQSVGKGTPYQRPAGPAAAAEELSPCDPAS
jgi:tRNA G18 (ribose-2'-O)-methylase SpoU